MWDAMDVESDGSGRSPGKKRAAGSSYDHLIDAEREALARSGGSLHKIALIRALRGASGLSLRDAKDVVEDYLARRGGLLLGGSGDDRPIGWIDDLLDAERAAALREYRSVTKILLIKTLREASGLGLKDAKDAVEDYLRRRGGEGLPSGSNELLSAIALILIVVTVITILVVARFG